ncbi:MAG: response regulator [Proteobacteria bacterium]|nr:response regulator [Pseudomonadota bacterium]MBU1639763.1 response regulator [Pseudomonadota bacterium]
MLELFLSLRQNTPNKSKVEEELLKLVMDNGYSSSVASMVLVVALIVMMGFYISPPLMPPWGGIMALIFIVRLWATRCYKRRNIQNVLVTLRCVRMYVAMVVATGLLWGFGVVVLFPVGEPLAQLGLVFIVAGLTAGAIPILSPMLRLYYFYIFSAALPLAYMLFSEGGEVYLTMSLILLFYLLVLINSAKSMQAALVDSLKKGFANEELVTNLKDARVESDALNEELVAENERRRQTEKELIKAKEVAEAASRSKDEFLANMSHEIRTPMNGILGTLQILEETDLQENQKQYVKVAHSSADALLTILNDILDFSKIEARKLVLEDVPFNLSQVVKELVSLFSNLAKEKSIDLKAEIDSTLPARLMGDSIRIRQILGNLLTNAIKFTDHGLITVRVHCLPGSGNTIGVRLEVEDTGIGIAKGQQDSLFQPFTQADGSTTRKYGGTGLGLAIVKQLVLLMGGQFGLSSELGDGSTFWCELDFLVPPSGELEAEEIKDIPAKIDELAGSVLLVEDNKVNQMVAMKMLLSLGLTVQMEENGERAFHACDENKFDLILMDCQMPVMDGYQATRAIREREKSQGLKRLPIIAMTANAIDGDRQKCLDAGMDDYLAKPVKKDVLREKLGHWLG